jgi:hypothetical protein
MKRFFLSVLAATTLLLAGCFENTQDITLKADGSGIISITEDLSSLMGLAKQTGSKDLEILNQVTDTTISLESKISTVPNLAEEEKVMMKKGTLHQVMDIKNEKFVITFNFPFTQVPEIPAYVHLSNKIMTETIKQQMGDTMASMGQDFPEGNSMEDYFTINYSKGMVERVLNKDKYATAATDEYLGSLKEASGMGIPVTTTLVINLPAPAKMVIGKNAKLSNDKKKVTIKSDIDDFFDDPSKMEFKIEY